jgi:hypothetical protein
LVDVDDDEEEPDESPDFPVAASVLLEPSAFVSPLELLFADESVLPLFFA